MLKPMVQVHNVDGIMVAEFWDCLRLDPMPVQELRQKYEAHLKAKGRPDVVVDLLGVGFAGSAALGNFMALHRLARQRGGGLIFCNVDPTVFEVFRVSKLESLFAFVADRPAALALAAQKPSSSPTSDTDGKKSGSSERSAPLSRPSGDGVRRSDRRGKIS
jgi:anti-anti-sigma factor